MEKFEKLKRYNQKLLAVLGSLATIFVFVGLIMLISTFFREMRYWFREEVNQEILSNEVAEENLSQNKRTHQIHFDEVNLVDTLEQIYIIPVSQTALDMIEFVARNKRKPEGLMGLMDTFDDGSYFYYADEVIQ